MKENGLKELLNAAKKVLDEAQGSDSYFEFGEVLFRVTDTDEGTGDKVINFLNAVEEKMENFFDVIDEALF